MVFETRVNSTPTLKMKLKEGNISNIDDIYQFLRESDIAFSLFDETNNIYIIPHKKATLEMKKREVTEKKEFPYDIYISYKFKQSDTRQMGYFRGEFLIFHTNTNTKLHVPVAENLYVNIKSSITKSDLVKVC